MNETELRLWTSVYIAAISAGSTSLGAFDKANIAIVHLHQATTARSGS